MLGRRRGNSTGGESQGKMWCCDSGGGEKEWFRSDHLMYRTRWGCEEHRGTKNDSQLRDLLSTHGGSIYEMGNLEPRLVLMKMPFRYPSGDARQTAGPRIWCS